MTQPTPWWKLQQSVAPMLTNNVTTPTASRGAMDFLNRADELRQRADAELQQPTDPTPFIEAQRRSGQRAQRRLLLALAAAKAGEEFAPLQAHFLKQALQQPIPVGQEGFVDTDGTFVPDPSAAKQRRAQALLQQAAQYERLAQHALDVEARQKAAEQAAQARREANELRQQIHMDNLAIRQQMLALQAAQVAAQGKAPPGYQWTPDGNLRPIPGGPADTDAQMKIAEAEARVGSAVAELQRLSESAANLLVHPGLTRATGVVGMVPLIGGTLPIPGSAPANFLTDLESLKSQIAYAVLQAMRDASPTGGAIGQVSNYETQLLQNNLAALDKARSPEEFRQSLRRIQAYAQGAQRRLQEALQKQTAILMRSNQMRAYATDPWANIDEPPPGAVRPRGVNVR